MASITTPLTQNRARGFVGTISHYVCGFRGDRARHSELMPPTVPI